jgi:glutaredoxin
VKEFLSDNKVSFEEKDIMNDFMARTYLQSKGVRGVPAILVGTELVQGFDKERLKQLLSI